MVTVDQIDVRRDETHRFIRNYCEDELVEALQEGRDSLVVEWSDLYAWDADFANDFLKEPQPFRELLEGDLSTYDLPLDIPVDLDVRVRLPRDLWRGITDVRADMDERYVAVEGRIAKTSERFTRPIELAYQCTRCSQHHYVPQDFKSVQEAPRQCGCESQSFRIDGQESTLTDHVVLEVQQPPGESGGSDEKIVAHCDGSLVWRGGFLPKHAGKRIVVHGKVREDKTALEKKNAKPRIDEFIEAKWIEFKDGVTEDLDVSEHIDEIRELAARDDAVDLLAESLVSEMWGQERKDTALRAAVAFMFGGYRVNPEEGRQYRGDIHGMFVGDPGTGKSTIASRVGELSPRSESVSGPQVTAAGLTASASQDSFGGSEWTLTPGVLPRATGGHVIIDELDKADRSATESLHDALEGEQEVKVAKANKQAHMETKVGLLTTANPEDGRFNKDEIFGQQLNIDSALFTRFDFIFAMRDEIDEEKDREIAESISDAWKTSATLERAERGETSEEVTHDTQPVADEIITAWVAHARDNCFPALPTGDAEARLIDYYVSTRQRNDDDAEAIPSGPRDLQAGIRLAVAFARVRLGDKVTEADVERAIEITDRTLADMHFDPMTGEWGNSEIQTGKSTQDTRKRRIKNAADHSTATEIAEATDYSESTVRNELELLRRAGEVYEPTTGTYTST